MFFVKTYATSIDFLNEIFLQMDVNDDKKAVADFYINIKFMDILGVDPKRTLLSSLLCYTTSRREPNDVGVKPLVFRITDFPSSTPPSQRFVFSAEAFNFGNREIEPVLIEKYGCLVQDVDVRFANFMHFKYEFSIDKYIDELPSFQVISIMPHENKKLSLREYEESLNEFNNPTAYVVFLRTKPEVSEQTILKDETFKKFIMERTNALAERHAIRDNKKFQKRNYICKRLAFVGNEVFPMKNMNFIINNQGILTFDHRCIMKVYVSVIGYD